MRKTKKRFLSALLACAMMISLFPFAAFADGNSSVASEPKIIYVDAISGDDNANDGTSSSSAYQTLEKALDSAQNGDTIQLAAGEYDGLGEHYHTDGILVSLKGVPGQTTINGALWIGAENGEWADGISNITVSGITFQNPQGASYWSSVGLGFTQIKNANITVDNCNFNGFQYGVHMNGTNAGTTLNVTNTDFENTFISISAQLDPSGATLGTIDNVKTTDGAYAVQAFGYDASGNAQNYHYTTVNAYEKAAENASSTTGMSGFDNSVLSEDEYVGAGEVKGNVVTTAQDLHDAITKAGTTPTTIILANDIELDESVVLKANQNITINGNDKTISYDGNNSEDRTKSNAAFKITGSLGDESSSTPANVSLTVNNVKFKSTAAGSNGYGVLVGANAKGANVKLDSCEFKNLYCGILVNPFTDRVKENVASISIRNSTFSNTTYGYSIDESSEGKLVEAVQTIFTNNGEITESEPWPSVQAYVTHDGFTTVAKDFATALSSATPGDVITLAKNLESTDKITLRAGVTLDGNGHSLTYTGSDQEQAFITADSGQDNVTIKNITINAKNIKHGVQFYCNKGGTLEKAVVNGGTYTSVIVNGATNVSIVDSDLNPAAGAYTNIEYAMGQNVTTIPSMSVDNVSFGSAKSYVYADDKTTTAVKNTMGGNPSNEEILDKILKNIVYTNPNGGNLNIVALFAGAGQEGTSSLTGSVESTYQPPYTGKYSYAINVADTDNGSVSVDKYATEGEKVTLTVSPDKAYKLDELTVTAGGKDVELTDNGDGTYTFTMPSSKVQISATFVEDENYEEPTPEEPSSDMPFGDVNTGDWFYDVVKYAYDNGLMTGTSATTFEPNTTTTRGMIVAILNRLEGNPTAADAGFADVNSGDWYADAVNWAASVGIVNGYSDTQFGPNDPITREQMAAILYNYAEYKGYDVSARADISSYDDAANVSDWAIESVQWANAMGLVNGMTDTTLDPQGNATRAQIAAILSRYLTGING